MALTAKKVEKLKQPGRYGDGHGLYLQVISPTNRSWLLRFERGGRERWMGLGATHTFSLREARERARKQRQLLADGIDPIDHRRKANESSAVEAAKHKTFAEVARAYLKAHEHDWKNGKHYAQWEASLTKDCRAIANVPVGAIDTSHVLEVLQPIWHRKPETASRTRARIERVLAYAVAAKYRKREDGNPARWDGHLQELLGKKSSAARAKRERAGKIAHHAALPYGELPQFMQELRERGSISARALEFLILTAARTCEVVGARRNEIDLAAKTWTVPASRMKMGNEHKVPLSDGALAILRALPREDGNPYLFVGGKKGMPLGNTALLQVLKDMRPDATNHGFRSTFRDWAAERTNYPNHVVEQALAHSIGDKTERAYRRGDLFAKRKQLMDAWSKYCASPPAAAREANVVPLRSA